MEAYTGQEIKSLIDEANTKRGFDEESTTRLQYRQLYAQIAIAMMKFNREPYRDTSKMRQINNNQLYHQNRLYKDMPKRTVTGEFFGGRVHCAEPETKPEPEPSFLLTRPEKKYSPKKSISKIQQQKILSRLVKKQQRLTRKQKEVMLREERLEKAELNRSRLIERQNQFLDFLRGENLPAKIGDLHKSFHKIVNYRTFQRRIQTLHEQGRITLRKVIGGKDGCTTLILKVNKVRQDAG